MTNAYDFYQAFPRLQFQYLFIVIGCVTDYLLMSVFIVYGFINEFWEIEKKAWSENLPGDRRAAEVWLQAVFIK